jgi:hypothetical protein
MMLDGKAVTDRSREPVGVESKESSCCNLPCLGCWGVCKRRTDVVDLEGDRVHGL